MKLLDLTLPTPAENLALDEALLDAAEADPRRDEVLRLWEPRSYFIVVGRSSQVEREVDVAACARRSVPIFRRSSGGAAIVAGPGCLMYAVVLSYARHPALRMLDQAHAFVLSRVADGLASLGLAAEHRGTSDLVADGRKISGNSLRCKREHLLYHGTLLYDFDLTLIGELLRMPPRQPDYRVGRDHGLFVANLPARADAVRRTLAAALGASALLADWPSRETERLAATRYSQDAWNRQR
ncbi:MAG: lipoate--protein ligase family protein [Planctomycetaceae bacterium]|nr:lipoate--protein ligase family protein [Planctomycetaceae bacterium]